MIVAILNKALNPNLLVVIVAFGRRRTRTSHQQNIEHHNLHEDISPTRSSYSTILTALEITA